MQSDIFWYELLRPNGANDMGCFNFKLVVPLLFMQLNFALSIRICDGHAATGREWWPFGESGERERGGGGLNGESPVDQKWFTHSSQKVYRGLGYSCPVVLPTNWMAGWWPRTRLSTFSLVLLLQMQHIQKLNATLKIAAQLVICTRC